MTKCIFVVVVVVAVGEAGTAESNTSTDTAHRLRPVVPLCLSHMASSMTEILSDLREKGYEHSFEITRDAHLRADSGEVFEPEDATIVDTYRFEGASDPDEMAVIYVLETKPRHGKALKGALIEPFGVYADPEESRVAERIKKAAS